MKKWFYLLVLVPGLVLAAFSSNCIFPLLTSLDQVCGAPGFADVTFHWYPSTVEGGEHYLDVSWYSNFPEGGYLRYGPFDENTHAFTVTGLRVNTVHHWRVGEVVNGTWYTSLIGTFTTDACGTSDGSAAPTGIRIIIPAIGVNAPINVRVIGPDGAMGVPNGKDDVIWYDFHNFSKMGGFPGIPGDNGVLSGHVDYHPNFTAVFWDLHLLSPGDEIDIQELDGSIVRFVVDWTQWIGPDQNVSEWMVNDGIEKLTIITCIGTFDPNSRSYSNRYLVRAVELK
jgi:Sortase domain